MKRFAYFLFTASLFAALVSCTSEIAPEEPSVNPEGITSFNASFVDESGEDGTRTHINMNASGTYANVLWDSGDRIKVANYTSAGAHSTGSHNEVVFQYSGDNSETGSAEFAAVSNSLDAKDAYLAFYPAASAGTFGTSARSITYTVPATQTATADGITSGYNYAAAFANHGTDLMLYNLLTPVRFTLQGSSAANVTKVVLTYNRNSDNIAGTATSSFSGSKAAPALGTISSGSLSITLDLSGISASTRAGKSFYIMTLPGASTGFSMKFYNGDTELKTLTSTNTTARKRGQILDLGSVFVNGNDLPSGVTRYLSQKKGKTPNVLVVTGDGWTSTQQSAFNSYATAALEYIFDTEPFKTYKDYFTVYIMPTTSAVEGKGTTDGNGNFTTSGDVNNYFGSSWSTSQNDMDLNWDYQDRFSGSSHASLKSFVETNCPEIASHALTINDVPIGILVNDSSWAGYSHWYWAGASYCMTSFYNGNSGEFSFGQNGYMVKNDTGSADADNMESDEAVHNSIGRHNELYYKATMLHELMGHGFGRLYDEYWFGYPSYFQTNEDYLNMQDYGFALNLADDYDDVPWQDFLDRRDALMAANHDYGRIGIYQGGWGYMFGIWRSEIVSCMIDHRPYFSNWQRWLLYNRIMEKCGLEPTLEEFFANDVTTDPVRVALGDGTWASAAANGTVFTHMPGGCVRMHSDR